MIKLQLLVPCLAVVLAESAFASGQSPTRPPRPPRPTQAPAAAERMDDARYAEGKAVFTGKAPLTRNPGATRQQRARLQALAAQTGESGRNLPALAGRLTADQLNALEYYVAHRYPAGVARR